MLPQPAPTESFKHSFNEHLFHQRVYVQHTDYLGIVYYANYLVFAEFARAEFLRDINISRSNLWRQNGEGFVVTKAESHFLKPAFLDDLLLIKTCVKKLRPLSLELTQSVWRNQTLNVCTMHIKLAWMKDQKATKIPTNLVKALSISSSL